MTPLKPVSINTLPTANYINPFVLSALTALTHTYNCENDFKQLLNINSTNNQNTSDS